VLASNTSRYPVELPRLRALPALAITLSREKTYGAIETHLKQKRVLPVTRAIHINASSVCFITTPWVHGMNAYSWIKWETGGEELGKNLSD
jgi:hypothetical protein